MRPYRAPQQVAGEKCGLAAAGQGVWQMPQIQSMSAFEEALRAFQVSRILLTAIELDVFSTVGDGAFSGEVAERGGLDPRATEILLNALVAAGALTKSGGTFRNTRFAARHLSTASPSNSRTPLLHIVNMWNSWSNLTQSVRLGVPVRYREMSERGDEWTVPFIAAMHRRAVAEASELVNAVGAEGVTRMLDVGGGSGAFSIAFARANPGLRAEVFDLESVVPIARRHIAEAGLAGRITARTGDLRRDDLGNSYDLILLSAICHMLGPEENRDLLLRCFRALAPGGRLVVRDFILEPDKTAPRHAAFFAVNMLVATPHGNTYTEEEYSSWLRRAGFEKIRRLRPSQDVIVARRIA
jgi:2-polyprenyl-3-methyl-5-hydroxy-6-metoxy-1,4-benzoquinol methylase